MFHSLKDLLSGALKRGRMGRQVEAARVLNVASNFLVELLPPSRPRDARVLSFQDGILTIECLNGSVADFVACRSEDFVRTLHKHVPDLTVRRIQTRLVTRFHDNMVTL